MVPGSGTFPHDESVDRDELLQAAVVRLLESRGVTLRDIAEVVYAIQESYYPDLTLEQCLESVAAVLAKREVQHVLLTGIALDLAGEAGTLPEPLCSILRDDDPLYGVDEVLALGITNVYGSIGLTNFGYLDKQKLGIIGQLNNRDDPGRVHVFLDDLVAAVAAAAAARMAHNARRRAAGAAGAEAAPAGGREAAAPGSAPPPGVTPGEGLTPSLERWEGEGGAGEDGPAGAARGDGRA